MPAAENNTRRSLPLLPIAVVGIVAVILAVAITFHTYSQPQPYPPQTAREQPRELTYDEFANLAPPRMRIDHEGNAARVYVAYGRALEQFSKHLQNQLWDELRDEAWLPDDEIIAVLELLDPVIGDVLDASHLDSADFVEGSWSSRQELEWLFVQAMGPTRTIARHLVYDAMRHMAEGDPDAAAERLAAVFRLSWHLVEGEPYVIPSMTSAATFGLAMSRTRAWSEEGLLTPEGVARIREAIEPYDPDDPFHVAEAYRNEGRVPAGDLEKWLEIIDAVKTAEGDRPEWAERARAELKLDLEDSVPGAFDEAYERAGEDWLEELGDVLREYWDGYERFTHDIADAIEDGDRIATLVQRRDDGEYGPIASKLDNESEHQHTHGAFMRVREIYQKLIMALDAADRGGD